MNVWPVKTDTLEDVRFHLQPVLQLLVQGHREHESSLEVEIPGVSQASDVAVR